MLRSMASFSMVSNLLNFLRGAAVGGGAAGGSSEAAAMQRCPSAGPHGVGLGQQLFGLWRSSSSSSTRHPPQLGRRATLTGREAFLSRSRCGRRRRSSAVRVRCGFVCAHGAPPPPYPPPPSPPPPSPAAALSRLVPRLVPRLLPRCAAALAGPRAVLVCAVCICVHVITPLV